MQAHGQEKQSHLILITAVLLGCAVVGAATAAQPVSEPNDVRWDLAEGFAFAWDSVELSAKSLNPAQNAEADSSVSERTLTIYGTLDILDANDLVAMHIEDPVIFAVRDADGNDVALELAPPQRVRQYEELKYFYPKVYPFDLSVRVHPAADQVLPSELSSLQGYVHAMYAEDVIKVDVPLVQTAVEWVNAPFYDPLIGWITVAPDLQIRVLDAYMAGDYFEYYTEVRSPTGVVGSLAVPTHRDDYVGDYVVIKTGLASADSWEMFAPQDVWMSWYTINAVNCFAQRGIKRGQGRYDKVCHMIALHPREVKIPFELKNIPVPSVEPVGP